MMEKTNENDDDLESRASRQPTSSLCLAPASSIAPARSHAPDSDIVKGAKAVQNRLKPDNIKGIPAGQGEQSPDKSSFKEVATGAYSVPGSQSYSNDSESQEPAGTYAYSVEAQVVEETSSVLKEGEELKRYEDVTRERLLAELACQAPQAEVVINEDKKQEWRLFRLGGCLGLVLLLIGAITTGVVVHNSGDGSAAGNPNFSLEPSGQPSLMPPVAYVSSTKCDEAQLIEIGANESVRFEDSDYVTTVFYDSESAVSYGRYFRYRGEGSTVVVSSDDTVGIHVYPDCLGSSSPVRIFYPNRETESTALWRADSDTDYLVFVSVPELQEETMTITFSLTSEMNDSPERAFGPLQPGPTTSVSGSTVDASFSSDLPACESTQVPSGRGAWYSVEGNGRTIIASTCGSVGALETQVFAFSPGDNSTGDLVCVDWNDDYCGGDNGLVAWSSKFGEIYSVLVQGKNDTEGTFLLAVTTEVPTEGDSSADANFCANAPLLDVGSTTTVDLSQATADPRIEECGETPGYIENPVRLGNFYRFVGTGRRVRIIVDRVSVGYTILVSALLTGPSCNALTCMDVECNNGCKVSTTVGRHYYVNVFYLENTFEGSNPAALSAVMNLTIEGSA